MIDRAILTPKNDDVDEINRILIDKLPGPITSYYCFDETIDSCQQGQQEDFLNSLTPNDLPPHELELKLNCPIDPTEGLCNGKRLICCGFQPNVIDAKIDVGDHRGKRVFIPKIPLKPSENAKISIPIQKNSISYTSKLCYDHKQGLRPNIKFFWYLSSSISICTWTIICYSF